MAKLKGKGLLKLVRGIVGRTTDQDDAYVGKKVFGRKGTAFEKVSGTITGVSLCSLGGCSGTRLHVKWPDGKRTYPCAKGCKVRKNGDMEIE